jgi:hypothetical protein
MKHTVCALVVLFALSATLARGEILKVQISAPGVQRCTLQYQFIDSDAGEVVPGEESYISRDIELENGKAKFDIEVEYDFEYVKGKLSLERGGFVSLFNLTFTSLFADRPVLHNYASSVSARGDIKKQVFNFLVPCNIDYW